MKKSVIYCAVILLLTAIFLPSCGELHYVETQAPETTESPAEGWTPADLSKIDGIDLIFNSDKLMSSGIKTDGECVYIWLKMLSNITGLYRFDLLTGKLSSVCTDPLCVGEECPFSKGSNSWIVSGDNVYYISGYEDYYYSPEKQDTVHESHYSFYRYDMKNQKNECLYEIPDDGSGYYLNNILSDGYLYYTRSQYIENIDEKKAYYEKYLCRTNPEEIGKTEEILYKLEGNDENGYSEVLEVTEDYFYFVTGAMNSNLVTRVSRADGSTDLMTYPFYGVTTARIGDYCYYLSCQGEPVDYITSTDGKGDVIVDENGDPVLTPRYRLYYTKRNLLTLEETVFGEAPYPLSSSSGHITGITDNYLYLDFEDGLWRCDHDGNKIKLIRSKEQSELFPLKTCYHQLIYGNWIFEADFETFVVYDMESGKYFTFELE